MRIVRALTAFIVAAALTVAFAAPSFAIPQKGSPAPPLKVVSTSGQQISLANYRGYVLVIDFFATWCPPCRDAVPHLNGLSRKYGKQGLQILGLSLDDGDEDVLKDFIVSKRLVYPVALAGHDIQTDYGLRSLPTVYVIDKRGNVADRFMGGSDATLKNMENLIKKLLAEK